MPVKIFCCYAHHDEALLNKLKIHLSPLQREGLIDVWHDRNISAGKEWESEISEHLNTADIILLLVSPDFMCKLRDGKQQQTGIKNSIPVVSSTVPKTLWRSKGCCTLWNDQRFTT